MSLVVPPLAASACAFSDAEWTVPQNRSSPHDAMRITTERELLVQ
jgi:hypothetical protein